jgi:hypothetical protein
LSGELIIPYTNRVGSGIWDKKKKFVSNFKSINLEHGFLETACFPRQCPISAERKK